MSGMSAEPSDALAAESYIDIDLLCHSCQYNLRGLDRSHQCPECGTAIESTLEPELMLLALPRTRELISRRLWQFQWWVIAAAVQLYAVLYYLSTAITPPSSRGVLHFSLFLLQCITPLLWLAAWSRLWFRREHFGFAHSLIVEPSRRELERGLLIGLCLLWAGYLIYQSGSPSRSFPVDTIRIIVITLMYVLFFYWIHHAIALRQIAGLCRELRLQRRGTVLLVIAPFALLCGLPILIGPTMWLLFLAAYAADVRTALLKQPATRLRNHLIE